MQSAEQLFSPTSSITFSFVQHLQRLFINTQGNFIATEKYLLDWEELNQPCVKWEAAGAELSYNPSPVLDNEAQ